MSLLGAIAISFLVTLLFMMALRPLAFSLELIDRPGGRKAHVGDVPIIGGLSMYLGTTFGIILLPALSSTHFFIVLAAGILVSIGLLDDRFQLAASTRLLAQLLATLIMVYGGQLIIADIGNPFGFGIISLGPFSLITTILITISVVNAFNLIDGVDGLAGCMAIVSLASLLVISPGGSQLILIGCVSVAAVLAFLLFNFPAIANRRVRSFMGDSGSTFLGFLVVWMTIGLSQGEGRVLSPVVGLWFASIPVYDLFTCFVRRISRGKSPFEPGRDHFHHLLKRGGMGVRRVLYTLTGLHAFYALIGLAGHFLAVNDYVMFAGWCLLGLGQRRIIRAFAVAYRRSNWRRTEAKSYI